MKFGIRKFNYIPFLPFLFVLINFFLKGLYLTNHAIAGDESFSVYYAQFNISTIINFLSQGNNPPLFEIILHFWIKIFGIGEFSVRFLPLIFSSLSVYFIFLIGFKYFNLKTAIIASILFTFSNFQIYYSHEVRVYSLFLLLSCFSIYVYIDVLTGEAKRKHYLLLILLNTLLLYAHYFAFFVLFSQFIGILLYLKTEFKHRIKILLFFSLSLLFFAPYFGVLLNNFITTKTNGSWIQSSSDLAQIHDFLYEIFNKSKWVFISFCLIVLFAFYFFLNIIFKNKIIKLGLICIGLLFMIASLSLFIQMPFFWKYTSNFVLIFNYLLFITFVFYLILRSNRVNLQVKFLILFSFLSLILVFIVSQFIPVFLNKYLIFLCPGIYVLIAFLLDKIELKTHVNLFSLLFVFSFVLNSNMDIDKKDRLKNMVQKVKEIQNNNTVIYLAPSYYDINFTYYYDRKCFSDIDRNANTRSLKSKLYNFLDNEYIYSITNYSEIDTNKIKVGNKILFIDIASNFSFPNNNIYYFLNKKYKFQTTYKFIEYYTVYEFKNN